MNRILIFLFVVFLSCSINTHAQKLPQLGFESIKEVIASMTLEEKVNMVIGVGKENIWERHGTPSVDFWLKGQVGATYAIERLGIPHTTFTDGPAGLRIDTIQKGVDYRTYCTAFPSATALASTWNKELVQKVGEAMGHETIEYGSDVLLAPGMNIQRNPLCGRNFEYFSEDPLVSGLLAAAMVNGIQRNGVSACIKHFVANNIETNRRNINAIVSQRALREIYLKGFEIALLNSNPKLVMTAYNKLNGYYTSENPQLTIDILRDEWSYKGLVVTDWASGKDFVAQMRAGNELLMPGNYQAKTLYHAVKTGILDESVLDRNIEKILEFVIQTPSFQSNKASYKPDLQTNAIISRNAAEEAMVLLENRANTLPLRKEKTVALFGKTSYSFIAGGTGSGDVNNRHNVSLLEGLKNNKFKIDLGLSSFYMNFIDSIKINGKLPENLLLKPKHIIDFTEEPFLSKKAIEESVKNSDIAIITIGRNSGEIWDRVVDGYFNLTASEKALIFDVCEIFHADKKKVIVILNIAAPIETASWKHAPDAILLAWQTGQEGGNALVDVLKGKTNPSGKLAVTFPVKYEDVPSASSFPGVPTKNPINAFYNEGIYVGYRYFDTFKVKPSYAFGYGQSYTNFSYSPLLINSKVLDDEIEVSVEIKNVGRISGKEIVQLYISAPVNQLEKPMHELRGFEKTRMLKPGESQIIKFKIDTNNLTSFWTGKSQWIAEKGEYKIKIASSSDNIRSTETFFLNEDVIVKQTNNVLYPNFLIEEITQN